MAEAISAQWKRAAGRARLLRVFAMAVGCVAFVVLAFPPLALGQGTPLPAPSLAAPPPVVAPSQEPVAIASPTATPPKQAKKHQPSPPKQSEPKPATAGSASAGAPAPEDLPSAIPRPDDGSDTQPLRTLGAAALYIAEPARVSISSDLRKRLPTALLVTDIRAALAELHLVAEIKRPFASEYTPPGDEEFSFAEGGSQDAITHRINSGYPDLTVPLVLITVAERGPYVIAAARVFSPDKFGGGSLRRVARSLVASAEASASIATNDWPACFARALRRFKDNPDDTAEDSCEKPALKGAVSDTAPGKTAAAPQSAAPASPSATAAAPATTAAPVQSPPQPPAATPRVQGMLDNVPTIPGVTAVIIPPSTSKGGSFPSPTKNGAPQPTIITPGVPQPTVVNPSAPSQPMAITPPVSIENMPPVLPPATARNVDSFSQFQLVEQILAYGFVFKPHDQTKLTNWVDGMMRRNDHVGQCLSHRDRPRYWLERDLTTPHTPPLQPTKLDKDYYLLVPAILDGSMVDSPSYCVPAQREIYPFYYLFYPRTDKVSSQDAQKKIEDLRASDSARREWRLPTAIEGFAIAATLTNENVRVNFWTTINGMRGMLVVKSDPNDLEVDHLVEPPPNKTANTLILVHN